MEGSVVHKYYIVLDMEDGSTLYLCDDSHKRHWSAFRREGRSWSFPVPVAEWLDTYKERGDIPPNARVLKVRTTIEEVK